MQAVLMDIHLAQSAVETKQIAQDSTSILLLNFYQKILHKHHITPQQLFASFDYYMEHPELMDAMYQQMIIDLSNKEEELKSK